MALHSLVLQVRKDVLAVGYGHFNFGPQQPGLVAFWSLKNPGHPLWTFPTSSGVTAVDFATQSPNMLAVGLYDGTLAVHDVSTRQVGTLTTRVQCTSVCPLMAQLPSEPYQEVSPVTCPPICSST